MAATRDKATQTMRELGPAKQALAADIESRRVWLLAQDAQYQEMVTRMTALKAELNAAMSISRDYKFRAGYMSRVFQAFHVEAEGDTWEEVFAKIEAKHPVKHADGMVDMSL